MLTLSTKFQKTQILFCGDINIPQTNWKTFHSEDDFEREVLDHFDKHCLQQAVTIPTCGKNTLDIALHRNLSVLCEENHIFQKLYNISSHTPVALEIGMPIDIQQSATKTAYSFNAADYEEKLNIMGNSPFEPTCYSNIDNMVNDFYVYLNDFIEKCVPRRTTHRQTLPRWFTPETSHLLKKLETHKKLLKLKPTAYRKQKMKILETEFWKSSEQDRIDYQTKIPETRNTDLMFKHFKRMSKESALPSTVVLNGQESNSVEETLNLFNNYFQSVYLPKNKSLRDIYCKDPKTTKFDTSVSTIRKYLNDLDETKSRGPDGIPPLFIKTLPAPLSKALNLIFRKIKRQKRIPKVWKSSAFSSRYKKSSKKDVSNYRPVAILDKFENVFEKCLYWSIYDCFSVQNTSSQHGFVKNKSVEANLLSFLQKVCISYDDPTTKSNIALYADMAKAFDKFPHYELIQKVSKIGIGGCLLEVLIDYLTD